MESFLSHEAAESIPNIRAASAEWFELAEDCNAALMRTAAFATDAVRTTQWDPKAVAVRVLLRSCSAFQGVILLAERGMVVESRTLARMLVENAFGLAALHDSPNKFVQNLEADFHASQHGQGKFVLESGIDLDEEVRQRLESFIVGIKKGKRMHFKDVAELGPLTSQYFVYQRLSNGAAHLSATSLNYHLRVNAARSGWSYKFGAGTRGEIAATLHQAVMTGISIGVAITQMLNSDTHNAEFASIADRIQAMPKVEAI